MIKNIYIVLSVFLFLSCNQEDQSNLESADVRIESAITELRDKLTAPDNGWVLYYRPVDDGGTYYILLEFGDENVRVQSDVPYDNGYLYDQTIPYKLDAQLQLVLTFETYAVFHYLFEQEQSTFGAEFEFYFLEDSDGELTFTSKSDVTSPVTQITLKPASANAGDMFAYDEVDNMQLFELYDQPLGTEVVQQIYIPSDNVSIFWTIDLLQRTIAFDIAAVGESITEIGTTDISTNLSNTLGFTFSSGSIILEESVTFNLNGNQYSFSSINLDEIVNTGQRYCSTDIETSPVYTGSIAGIGACEIRHTLYQSSGTNFNEQAEIPYSVNVFFVADSTGASLSDEDEVIGVNYPDATGFVFNYGLIDEENPSLPKYAIGITYEDESGISQTDYRGFEPVVLDGNMLKVTLNEIFYYTKNDVSSEDEDRIRAVTDEVIGEEGGLYVSEWPVVDDLVIFRLFNPCNGNEFVLVQP